jgi:hypothetical protein
MVLAVDAVIPNPKALDAQTPTLASVVATIVGSPLRLDAVITATTVVTDVATINMVSGDTRPTLEFTVKDENGIVINLTGASGFFRIRRVGETTVRVSHAVTITDAPNGKCQFAWLSTDWNPGAIDAPGNYEGELEITFSGGGLGSVFPLYQIAVRTEVG